MARWGDWLRPLPVPVRAVHCQARVSSLRHQSVAWSLAEVQGSLLPEVVPLFTNNQTQLHIVLWSYLQECLVS